MNYRVNGMLLQTIVASAVVAADLPGSKDPPGLKRYEGSEIIGYRAPRFDEFLLPLGPATAFAPAAYQKSLKTEGLVSRHTYVAPAGRSPAELFRNYKLEFQRMGLAMLYEYISGAKVTFGSTLAQISDEDQLGQILQYNENQERVLVAKSNDPKPTYYELFVTAYLDGVIPERLEKVISKDRAMALFVVIAPEQMELT
jgi:OmpA-OmpF porin, OOP family